MRIVIVDDDALIRDALSIILATEEGFQVVGTAKNGQEGVEQWQKLAPDIIIMDIRMPIMDGVEATRLIKQQSTSTKILLLTTFKDIEYIRSAVQFGAEGYILKSNSSESIIESLRTIQQGNVVFEKEIAGLLSNIVEKEKKSTCEELSITPKEYEIMECVSIGLSNKEISEKLFMSEGTVRNKISVLLEKLSLRDRTQLAIFFIRKLER